MKIYFHWQCFIEFWFSSSNQLQKTFKIPQCNVHSLLAKFYLTRTPVNYKKKFSKKMTKSISWKIYIRQQRRNLWCSFSGKLHERSKITQCNKTRKRSKCFTHHIDPMLSYAMRIFLFYERLWFFYVTMQHVNYFFALIAILDALDVLKNSPFE